MVDAGEALRGDADHRELDTAQRDPFVHDGRVSGEVLSPLIVIEYHDRIAPRHVVFITAQRPTESGTHLHRLEEIAAHGHPDLPLGWFVRTIREAGDDERIRDGVVEALGPVAQVHVVGIRQPAIAKAGVARLTENRDHFARTGHRKWTEHQPVGDAEHRRVGADADGDRHDRDDREARVLHQHPEAVVEISDHC